jgi:CBS domain-containing protein
MADSIVRAVLREVTPLRADEPVGVAARLVVESELPGLPVVDEQGKFAGIFGEREFMAALFPGYVAELASSAMIRRTIDETIERRESCREEPVSKYMTTDHVAVDDDYSDTQLAELFLHHRVLVIPVATEGRVHAVVTRSEFFRALVAKLRDYPEDVGD